MLLHSALLYVPSRQSVLRYQERELEILLADALRLSETEDEAIDAAAMAAGRRRAGRRRSSSRRKSQRFQNKATARISDLRADETSRIFLLEIFGKGLVTISLLLCVSVVPLTRLR